MFFIIHRYMIVEIKTSIHVSLYNNTTVYCKIIIIRWIFNFVYFVGSAIQEIKIPTKIIFIYFSNIAYELKSIN